MRAHRTGFTMIPEGFKGLGKDYMIQAIDTMTKDHLRERFAARMGSSLNP